jgi:glycosyltransferase involved in cell wall biosynthesis
MRIAQIAPLDEAVPPKLYGGTERIVSCLTEELVALGHDVTLFASGDSVTSARLAPMCRQGLRLDRGIIDRLALYHLMLERVAQAAEVFDILHFHLDHMVFPLFRRVRTPSLTTLHGRLDPPELANWVATIHHGLPPLRITPVARSDGYLAFLGRFSQEKRPDLAIRMAQRANCRIRIAAKVDPTDQFYFEEVIAPLLVEPHVDFVGEINEEAKQDFLARARALLFPINWPEPFGLVMIEAMRCGTPVIAFRHGSVAEVIEDGVTGFIVDSEAEALAAIERVDALDRRRIREIFLERFSSRTMAEEYLALYRTLASPRTGAGGELAARTA